MDKATAKSFIERIEAHRAEEEAIWDEMRNRPDYGLNEDNGIREIIESRAMARELTEEAESNLDAFDWVDDGEGNLVPREELTAPAWPSISARLREIAGADRKLLPMVEQIDRLHALAAEKGIPEITRADLVAALAQMIPE